MYKIDSFRIFIKADKCNIIEPLLNGCVLTEKDTGEILTEEFKQSSLRKELGYTSTYWALYERYDFNLKKNVQYLVILLNSKLLAEDYFRGITIETIELLYNFALLQKVASFSYEDFLDSQICDVDICKDFKMEHNDYKDFCSNAVKYIKTSCFSCGYKIFTKANNAGFQISQRDAQNSIKNPFVKVYYKGKEIQQGQNVKLLLHILQRLENEGVDNSQAIDELEKIRRCEVTIKNNVHYKHLTSSDNRLSLKDILTQDLSKLFFGCLDVYFSEKTFEDLALPSESKLSGKDVVIFSLLKLLQSQGHHILDIEDYILSYFADEPVQKSRTKTLLKNINKQLIEVKKYTPVFSKFYASLRDLDPTMM